MSVTILRESELRDLVRLDTASLEAVAEAFTWLADGRASMPPVMHIEVPDHGGDVDIKSAYVSGLDHFAVKMAAGFPGNVELGLPTGTGLMVLLEARSGACRAVLLDNGYLTDLRTALAGAVAARHLAPARVHTVGVVGTGVQAREQIRALALVRSFERVLVFGRTPERVTAYVQEMAPSLGIVVEEAPSVERLVAESQVVVTTTAAREPLIQATWLHPGLHITAMGSDLPGKQELAPEVLCRADIVVCDVSAQCAHLGELQHALAAGLLGQDAPAELGELTSGRLRGRTEETQVTVCDLTGAGVQDTAIASRALELALQAGAGASLG